jgi:hypothetical protein
MGEPNVRTATHTTWAHIEYDMMYRQKAAGAHLKLIPRLCSSLTSCRELTMITSPCSMAAASLGISTWTIRLVASRTSLSSSGVDALGIAVAGGRGEWSWWSWPPLSQRRREPKPTGRGREELPKWGEGFGVEGHRVAQHSLGAQIVVEVGVLVPGRVVRVCACVRTPYPPPPPPTSTSDECATHLLTGWQEGTN